MNFANSLLLCSFILFFISFASLFRCFLFSRVLCFCHFAFAFLFSLILSSISCGIVIVCMLVDSGVVVVPCCFLDSCCQCCYCLFYVFRSFQRDVAVYFVFYYFFEMWKWKYSSHICDVILCRGGTYTADNWK